MQSPKSREKHIGFNSHFFPAILVNFNKFYLSTYLNSQGGHQNGSRANAKILTFVDKLITQYIYIFFKNDVPDM